MVRFPAILLLSLCVIAMPSYAAMQCGSACAVEAAAHEHDCCPITGVAQPAMDLGGEGSHSNEQGSHHCAAPCCGYVAHVIAATQLRIQSEPLADSLPTGSLLRDSVNHHAIFHPPRV